MITPWSWNALKSSKVEEAASYLWNGLLTIGGAVIVLFIKSHHSNVQRIEILLNKTREQVARDYVNKTDLTADMNRILDRFDRPTSQRKPLKDAA